MYLYNWSLTELRLNFSSSKLACKHEWDFCIGFSISWLIPWGLQLPIKACLLNHSPQEFGKDLCLFVCIIKSALASPSTTFFFFGPSERTSRTQKSWLHCWAFLHGLRCCSCFTTPSESSWALLGSKVYCDMGQLFEDDSCISSFSFAVIKQIMEKAVYSGLHFQKESPPWLGRHGIWGPEQERSHHQPWEGSQPRE